MIDIFLRFKDKRHNEAYNKQTKLNIKASYKGAIMQLFIFSIIEFLLQLGIFISTKNDNLYFFERFYGLFYDIIILIICLVSFLITHNYTKFYDDQENLTKIKRIKYDFIILLFLTGIGYIDIAFLLLAITQNDLVILICIIAGFKSLWKFFIGCTLLQTTFSKCVYFLEMLAVLLIHFSESNTNAKKETIYIFVFLEYLFLIYIPYYNEKIRRLAFIEKFQEIETGNTLKFILNEIPENIVITDPNLVPKFISRSLSGVEIIDLMKNIKNLKKRKSFAGHRAFSDLLSIEISQNEDDVKNWLSRAQIYDAVYKEIEKESEGQSLYDLCVGNNCTSSLYNALKSREPSELSMCVIFDCKLIHPELNITKTVELKVSLASFNQEECMIFIFRDTAQRDIIARLEDNNHYKERLLASITHEVRTPLNGNLGMLESAIQDEFIPESIKEKYLLPAMRSGKLLMNIINDILDFSQINAKALRLVFAKGNVRKTIEDCLLLVKFQAEKKGLKLLLEISSDVPEEFCTDHSRLTQIILNLVTNAIKFTFKGQICIVAKMIDEALEISVEDTGIGIKPENIKDLFKPMISGNYGEQFQMNCAGIGLGLWISYKLAQLLSPQQLTGLFVKSTYSVGTKFAFLLESKKPTLPDYITISTQQHDIFQKNTVLTNTKNLDSEEDFLNTISEGNPLQSKQNLDIKNEFHAQYPRLSPESCFSNLSKNYSPKIHRIKNKFNQKFDASPKLTLVSEDIECKCPPILVIDDDGFNHLAIESLLQKLGYACTSSFNGALGIEKVLQREKNPCGNKCIPYQIIFMDCNMPIMNGYEATIKLREMMRNKEIRYSKIIACTSYTTPDKTDECIKSGMDGFISKPLSIEKMREILKANAMLH